MSKNAHQSENNLNIWRLCSELDIFQAALLINNHDPADYPEVHHAKAGETPSGYDAALSAIKAALRTGELICTGAGSWGEIVNFDEVKDWLEAKGVENQFFCGNAEPQHNYKAIVEQLKQHIEELQQLNADLQKRLSEVTKEPTTNHPCKDSTTEYYSPELELALKLWEELYLNAKKSEYLSHTAAATRWLERHDVTLKRQKERLSAITNPAINKIDQQER